MINVPRALFKSKKLSNVRRAKGEAKEVTRKRKALNNINGTKNMMAYKNSDSA